MLPGPVIVNECPKCHGLVLRRTLASGNTIGAKRWTDGEFRARMLPTTPSLVRCGHCKQVTWKDEFKKIDSYESYLGFLVFSEDENDKQRMQEAEVKQDKYDNLSYFEEPSPEELVEYISRSTLSDDKELYTRTRIWRKWNDARRDDDSFKPLHEAERLNLSRIVKLIEATSENTLILAEAYRELGDFRRAKNILEQHLFNNDEQPIAEFLRELIDHDDSQVCLIAEEGDREWRILRRLRHRNEPNPSFPPFDPGGPPVFEIASRDWWVKPVGMLVHNWALIDRNNNGNATVYFFHDRGVTKNGNPKFTYRQLKGRCAVIDYLDFEDKELAAVELKFNGFQELSKKPGPWDGSEPFGTFYDARETEEGVYSRGGYWEKMS